MGTAVFSRANINVLQQVNASRGDIAYNVIDVVEDDDFATVIELQEQLTMVDSVISTRLIVDHDVSNGKFYAKKIDGVYHQCDDEGADQTNSLRAARRAA